MQHEPVEEYAASESAGLPRWPEPGTGNNFSKAFNAYRNNMTMSRDGPFPWVMSYGASDAACFKLVKIQLRFGRPLVSCFQAPRLHPP